MKSIQHTLRRRWWVVVLAPALVLLATLFALPEPAVDYQARAILFVPSGAGQEGGPGGANEAGRLAQQYTRLIPADQRIMQGVADSMGTDLATTQFQAAPRGDPRLVTRADQLLGRPESEAVAGRDAVILAVTEGVEQVDTVEQVDGVEQVEQNAIPPNFLQVISRDITAAEGSGQSSALGIAALIGGLVIGIGGAIALERSDVHVDDIDLAVRRTGVPGSDLDDMPDQSIVVLMRHWADLGSTNPVETALLGVERGGHTTTNTVARRLQRVQERAVNRPGGERGDSKTRSDSRTTRLDPDLLIRVGGAPGTIESGEWVAIDCSVTVLVVPRGTRLRSVEEATSALRQLDLGPTWLLLTDRRDLGGRTGGGARRDLARRVPTSGRPSEPPVDRVAPGDVIHAEVADVAEQEPSR